MNAPITTPGRTTCLRELRARFGWLEDELYGRCCGNISLLDQHKQILWGARSKAVSRLNRISTLRDLDKRERAYRKLAKDLKDRRS